jgi:hypothetical protein
MSRVLELSGFFNNRNKREDEWFLNDDTFTMLPIDRSFDVESINMEVMVRNSLFSGHPIHSSSSTSLPIQCHLESFKSVSLASAEWASDMP